MSGKFTFFANRKAVADDRSPGRHQVPALLQAMIGGAGAKRLARNFRWGIAVILVALAVLVWRSSSEESAPAPEILSEFGPPAFWIWHRGSELRSEEVKSLEAAGVPWVARQIAELEWNGRDWVGTQIAAAEAVFPDPAETWGFSVMVVMRLKPDPRFLAVPGAATKLAQWLRKWRGPTTNRNFPGGIQLDFDCPGHSLARYERFGQELRKSLGETMISATALASWARQPGFRDFAAAFDSLAPMFYDLQPDPPAEVRAGRFEPLADPRAVQWLDDWKSCPVRWRIGLANFERLSLFRGDGTLSGHLRGWSRDELFFHPLLEPERLAPGTWRFRVLAATRLEGTALAPDDILIYRQAAAEGLAVLSESARRAGASGVVYFALPGPGLPSTREVAELAAPERDPEWIASLDQDGRVKLRNSGPVGLVPRPLSQEDGEPLRGWVLRISLPPGLIESADLPGEFSAMSRSRSGEPTIYLHFPELAAGETLISGAILPGISTGVELRVLEAAD